MRIYLILGQISFTLATKVIRFPFPTSTSVNGVLQKTSRNLNGTSLLKILKSLTVWVGFLSSGDGNVSNCLIVETTKTEYRQFVGAGRRTKSSYRNLSVNWTKQRVTYIETWFKNFVMKHRSYYLISSGWRVAKMPWACWRYPAFR